MPQPTVPKMAAPQDAIGLRVDEKGGEKSEIGYGLIVGDAPEGWQELAEANSRALDEMMLMVGRPLHMQVRELPK